MKQFRRASLAGAGVIALSIALLLPTSANAAEAEGPAKNLIVPQTQVIEGAMTVDCSTFTEQDRQRAVSEGLNFCGSLDAEVTSSKRGVITPMGSTVGDCGVSSIYVERWGAKLRISYGMHSTAGVIVTRSLDVTWGPAATGSNYDFGAVGRDTYTNSIFSGAITSGNKAGGTLRGTATIAGWTFACWVSADDPVHTL